MLDTAVEILNFAFDFLTFSPAVDAQTKFPSFRETLFIRLTLAHRAWEGLAAACASSKVSQQNAARRCKGEISLSRA